MWMNTRLGLQFGNYRLIQQLGQGGFAEVYLGKQLYLGSLAAVKVLSPCLAQDAVAGFLAEARCLVRLSHPHIIRFFDFGVESGTPFLIMDYAQGGTLRQRHPRGTPLPLVPVIDYVKQIASALEYAHSQHLIHRDVKPENLLIGRQGDVLLSDFGIALLAQSSRSLCTQNIVGTISYMAPEQLQGRPRPASDQYALAVIVYEWLCGAPPFAGSFAEIAAKHCYAEPPSLRARTPTIPAAVEQVVRQALAKRPDQRFPSVQAFAAAFERAARQRGLPPVVSPLGMGRPRDGWRLEDDFEGVSLQ
jgi:eukaryotic-like serine/threonine-protein kinase